MRQLTIFEAWAVLAEVWGGYGYYQPLLKGVFLKGTVHRGICHSASTLYDERLISWETWDKMTSQIRTYGESDHDPDQYPYHWPLSSSGARKRRSFCLTLADGTHAPDESVTHLLRLSELQAWSYLGSLWYAYGDQISVLTGHDMPRCVYGLCASVDYLAPRLTDGDCLSMRLRLRPIQWTTTGRAYMWPLGSLGAKSRAAFCRQQVEQIIDKSGESS